MGKYEVSYLENSSRNTKHINSKQEWKVKVVNGRTIKLQLAGFRRNGERNTFAMKHLLMPSKKGIASDIKAERKLMHRVDHHGKMGFNPHQGAKVADNTSQTRSNKYGSAASLRANSMASNTCIDLSLINLQSVLEKMVLACDTAQWDYESPGHVTVDFGVACVRHVSASWDGTAANAQITHQPLSTSVTVTGQRVGKESFEIYHLGGRP